ncbi:hypothetical protein CsSME_00034865 [Camellia sinensis var. sinensis]
MIKGLNSTMKKNATNLGQLVEKDIPAVLEDVECCLAKHDFYIKLLLARVIDSSVRQILHCFEAEQLKVIAISRYSAEMLTAALEYQSVKRGMFNLVINVCIHGLTGTDISLPLDETLKPYKFLLFLDCRKQIIDPHDLKIPKHGSVVLGFRHRNVHDIGLVDLEIKMEDHLLLWSLFWKNVDNFPSKIEPIASQLVQLCHNHLLAIILLARALKSVTDVRVWQHALGELASSSFSSLMEAGKHVLEDLIKSFLLEKVSEGYVRMREETREGLGLSEAPEVAEWDAKEIYLNNNHLSELPEKPNCPSLVTLFLQENYDLMEIPSSFFRCMPMLQVLDLSRTSIKSLLACISRLVSLQELFLRGGELLMELPLEIGALLKLQVLDLEGTEIMYLPKEISGLKKLECLKVSLYGYGKHYREDGDEWVADVKDVTNEPLKLEPLMSLKFISSGLLLALKLERIIIYACPMLESLSLMELSSNYLKVIKGEIEWWNSLKWLESEWSSKRKDYVANVFVELERDASLMDQLAKSGNSKEKI